MSYIPTRQRRQFASRSASGAGRQRNERHCHRDLALALGYERVQRIN